MNEKQKKQLRWQLPFLLLLVAGTIFIVRQQRQTPYQQNNGSIFGTFYHVTYQHSDNLLTLIEAELQKVDGEFSMFNEQSTVARINRGEQPERSAMFQEVYQLAQTVSRETGGAFDITVAPLVNAWGFGFKHEQMPTPQQVDSLLKIRSQLDFAAIAKGYGCDVVARLLERKGVTNYMVEIGGEVATKGISPSRMPWRIGVSKPTDDSLGHDSELQTVLNVTDRAMATSGNYRNFYYKGGRKYAHTIDPRTGYPVQHNILSATVLADNCATADAYATAFMVLGLDGAREVLDRHPELMAYLIYTDEQNRLTVWCSPGLKALDSNSQ
jgi:thiamine biosynthesis lipoprotein